MEMVGAVGRSSQATARAAVSGATTALNVAKTQNTRGLQEARRARDAHAAIERARADFMRRMATLRIQMSRADTNRERTEITNRINEARRRYAEYRQVVADHYARLGQMHQANVKTQQINPVGYGTQATRQSLAAQRAANVQTWLRNVTTEYQKRLAVIQRSISMATTQTQRQMLITQMNSLYRWYLAMRQRASQELTQIQRTQQQAVRTQQMTTQQQQSAATTYTAQRSGVQSTSTVQLNMGDSTFVYNGADVEEARQEFLGEMDARFNTFVRGMQRQGTSLQSPERSV
jgi:uncharacterized protein with PIN domain